ncbi:hypothetical protein [Candidatus Pantoea persica]|uniref:hypothetical protein n=1 Tax=Candidatus Pantoea persica TaxID=2518128 RepID=UPI00215D8DBD|nr:hypothetical protein [Candidatus Pantoea persica]MBA2814733.1 GDP-mannose 4,6 dehydratase/hypothetical protein [Candidatus Pantoea persica]
MRYLVKSYAALFESNAFGLTANVASGKMHSLLEIINMCEEITVHSIRIEINPQFARVNEIKELCGDISLLNQLTHHQLRIIPLRENLKWMLEV